MDALDKPISTAWTNQPQNKTLNTPNFVDNSDEKHKITLSPGKSVIVLIKKITDFIYNKIYHNPTAKKSFADQEFTKYNDEYLKERTKLQEDYSNFVRQNIKNTTDDRLDIQVSKANGLMKRMFELDTKMADLVTDYEKFTTTTAPINPRIELVGDNFAIGTLAIELKKLETITNKVASLETLKEIADLKSKTPKSLNLNSVHDKAIEDTKMKIIDNIRETQNEFIENKSPTLETLQKTVKFKNDTLETLQGMVDLKLKIPKEIEDYKQDFDDVIKKITNGIASEKRKELEAIANKKGDSLDKLREMFDFKAKIPPEIKDACELEQNKAIEKFTLTLLKNLDTEKNITEKVFKKRKQEILNVYESRTNEEGLKALIKQKSKDDIQNELLNLDGDSMVINLELDLISPEKFLSDVEAQLEKLSKDLEKAGITEADISLSAIKGIEILIKLAKKEISTETAANELNSLGLKDTYGNTLNFNKDIFGENALQFTQTLSPEIDRLFLSITPEYNEKKVSDLTNELKNSLNTEYDIEIEIDLLKEKFTPTINDQTILKNFTKNTLLDMKSEIDKLSGEEKILKKKELDNIKKLHTTALRENKKAQEESLVELAAQLGLKMLPEKNGLNENELLKIVTDVFADKNTSNPGLKKSYEKFLSLLSQGLTYSIDLAVETLIKDKDDKVEELSHLKEKNRVLTETRNKAEQVNKKCNELPEAVSTTLEVLKTTINMNSRAPTRKMELESEIEKIELKRSLLKSMLEELK